MITLLNLEEFMIIDVDDHMISVEQLYIKIQNLFDEMAETAAENNESELTYSCPIIKVASIRGFCAVTVLPGWEFTPESYPSIKDGMITLANGIEYSSELIVGTGVLERQHDNGTD